MFRLTRNLVLLNKKFLKLRRSTSNYPSTNDQSILNKDDQSILNKDEQDDSNKIIELDKHFKREIFKKELDEFKNDLDRLSLVECLEKYECSIKDALQMDPNEQKRIVIKGRVVTKFKQKTANRFKLKIFDTNDLIDINVLMPDHVLNAHSDRLSIGCSVVLTGLLFSNKILNQNSLYCDKIIYGNQINLACKPVADVLRTEKKITDWFDLRNYPSLKFQSQTIASLIKLRSQLINQIHKLMNDEQFIYVTTPTLTSWPLSGDVFMVKNNNRDDYFYSDVYLNKASDKHLETIVNAIPQIYTINHSFDPSLKRSKQTVNEKLMLEVAQLTDDSIDDLMNQCEYFTKKLSFDCSSQFSQTIKMIRGERGLKFSCNLENVDYDYIRMTYDEALDFLKERQFDLKYGEELNFHHKSIISEYFQQYPVFIHSFPYSLTNDFDTLRIDDKAQRFELLIGRGLSFGCGKIKSRDSYDQLCDKFKELNLDINVENLNWYLDLKKKGAVPSSWFSLSLDLFLMAFTDLPSLRDIILFPRVPKHCEL